MTCTLWSSFVDTTMFNHYLQPRNECHGVQCGKQRINEKHGLRVWEICSLTPKIYIHMLRGKLCKLCRLFQLMWNFWRFGVFLGFFFNILHMADTIKILGGLPLMMLAIYFGNDKGWDFFLIFQSLTFFNIFWQQ